MTERNITLSIVSHRQNVLVNQLLGDIEKFCADRVALIVTENVPDGTPISTALPFEHIANAQIKGFGANHNAAFKRCGTPYFCVCNPDIRLARDPFPALQDALAAPNAAVAGPLVRNPQGGVEDSARRFPTAWSLLKKTFVERRQPDYPSNVSKVDVDWIAGMFMLFREEVFAAMKGFDEAYFLYYEDVDLCRRLRAAGRSVLYVPAAEVVHDARRASRREPHLALHHLRSVARFLSRS